LFTKEIKVGVPFLDAHIEIAAWRRDYNEQRPHSALDYRTPAEFAAGYRQGPKITDDEPEMAE